VFDRYLLVSPSIWWDGAIGLRFEQEWAQQHQDLPVRVFLGVGAQEQLIADTWLNEQGSAEALQHARQVDNVRTLGAQLQDRGYPGLRLDAVVFEGEYHFSVFPAAVTRGLLALYTEDPGEQPERVMRY
jgi:predicted alpha/beta superfamily hydrolase